MENDPIITPLSTDDTISEEHATALLKYYVILDIIHGDSTSKLIKEASCKKFLHPITNSLVAWKVDQ